MEEFCDLSTVVTRIHVLHFLQFSSYDFGEYCSSLSNCQMDWDLLSVSPVTYGSFKKRKMLQSELFDNEIQPVPEIFVSSIQPQ